MSEISYKDFINNIITQRGRKGCVGSYYETHHILPKCLGGTNESDNLIDLYAHEHFIAHKLLAIENPNNQKLVNAYAIMAFTKNPNHQRQELTPSEYEQARKAFSNSMKEKWKDENYRKMQSNVLHNRWKDSNYRKQQSERRTELNFKMWADSNFKQKMREKTRERWSNMTEEQLNKHRELMQKKSNQLWNDSTYIKKHYTPVFCIETQEYFLCQKDAIKKYNISASSLSSHLAGKQKSAGKHIETKKPLHWKKVSWEECYKHYSDVCPSEKINLLNRNEV